MAAPPSYSCNSAPTDDGSAAVNDNFFHAHRQSHNSSKLPAFRFADLKRDTFVLPSLLQDRDRDREQERDAHNDPSSNSQSSSQQILESLSTTLHHNNRHNQSQSLSEKPASIETHQQPTPIFSHQDRHQDQHQDQHSPPPPASATATTTTAAPTPATVASDPAARASTFQLLPTTATTATSIITTTTTDPSTGSKRPASFPDHPCAAVGYPSATRFRSSFASTPVAKRRQTTSIVANNSDDLPVSLHPALSAARRQATFSPETAHPSDTPTGEWAQGQRQLLLPKALEATKPDEKKRSRPPVSYRHPHITSSSISGSGQRAVIPPIRSFRSSGSRKSVALDMHNWRNSDDYSDDISDPDQRDRTLRALEGRGDDDLLTPPESVNATQDNDNTAEIFMRIAREDSTRRPDEDQGPAEDQSAISRLTRASQRRPLSQAVNTYLPNSPPQLVRRFSDQREARNRKLADDQPPQQMTRESAHRGTGRERPASTIFVVPPEDSSRVQTTPLRPSPITPRQSAFQDVTSESSSVSQRRGSVPEGNIGFSASKYSQYRNANFAFGQGRTYNSSPLVPKPADVQKHETHHGSEVNHGVEGTESSASTAAPSTVWDELDDLKSRIHRLELTGKIPPTSGAAISRASDERPPTATTNATTMSASPKRSSAANEGGPADASSIASSQRETQPILMAALSKTKGLVSSEVYSAIESAASDALSLSSMVGAPGKPGLISSGASVVGGGMGVTDRQLRRKADSICRSLTELCIALADEIGQTRSSQPAPATREADLLMMSPKAARLTTAVPQKRPSAVAETVLSKAHTSPRAPTTLEQRRLTMLNGATLPSPRFIGVPSTPLEPHSVGRKSSLLLARTRRAGTEEPEETPGRRTSMLLRTRRAATEDPEESHQQEGRKTSLFLRSRKTSDIEEDDESRFRTPSRAITEVNGMRATQRDLTNQTSSPPDNSSLGSSALPRRRLVPSSLHTRLVTPSTPAKSNPGAARRYLERTTLDKREPMSATTEKFSDEPRASNRHFSSLSQTAMLNRTNSLPSNTVRRRESGIPSFTFSSSLQGSGNSNGSNGNGMQNQQLQQQASSSQQQQQQQQTGSGGGGGGGYR